MPSFSQYGDSPFTFEGAHFPYPPFQQFEQSDSLWISTDPALTQLQHEYELQQKHDQNVQQEALAFQQSVAHTEYLQCIQQITGTSGPFSHQSSWNFPCDGYRITRYNSPNGQYGGTLSASSSEYGLSPEYRRSSIAISNCSQPFARASALTEPCLSQQNIWHNDHDLIGALPSPPDSTIIPNTQAIALRELEFSGGPDYYRDQYLCEVDTTRVKTGLLMHVPEELELTDSIATLTTSSRADTLLTHNGAEDESELDERDPDSDSEFHPLQLLTRRPSQLPVRSVTHPRSPRRHAPIQSHPVQDPKTRVQKPARRSTSHGNKERRRSRTLVRPVLTKSYSAGSTKAPRYFPCTFHVFGCTAIFANKNEWKRHVSSQHLQLGYFRCDLGDCNPDNVVRYCSSNENRHRRKSSNVKKEEVEVTYNDFNRKDLFTQHCRRMHGPQRYTTDSTSATNQKICERADRLTHNPTSKQKAARSIVTKEDEADFEIELEDIRKRCWQTRRKAPARSCCGFCNKVFQTDSCSSSRFRLNEDVDDDGKAEEKAWEERMEHIGKHYERDNVEVRSEPVDEDLEEWGLTVGILERHIDMEGNERSWLIGSGPSTYSTTTTKDEGIDTSPRRSGLRSRGQPSISRIKTEDEMYVKKEEINSDNDSDDDASAEEE